MNVTRTFLGATFCSFVWSSQLYANENLATDKKGIGVLIPAQYDLNSKIDAPNGEQQVVKVVTGGELVKGLIPHRQEYVEGYISYIELGSTITSARSEICAITPGAKIILNFSVGIEGSLVLASGSMEAGLSAEFDCPYEPKQMRP
ncbi:TPA: hypothetical protein LMR99_001642 [Vibrio alginolyticus]|nr:hypothetical protein [Vibrio alginolyticus]HBK6032149.1 hypothetical protein [Vibrio alginolyticus]